MITMSHQESLQHHTDKPTTVLRLFEHISMIIVSIPFVLIMLFFLLQGEPFALFPLSLMLFLPCGVFALTIQYLKTRKHLPCNGRLLTVGWIAVGFGILGWMAIYVVVGG